MATRSTIAILKEDNSVQQIYCHNDGYIRSNGAKLFCYYQDSNKVKEMISLGDMSVLAQEVSPSTTSHSFDKPESNICIFYGRDRGEKGTKARYYGSLERFLSSGQEEEYNYLFKEKNQKWYLIDRENNKLKPLKTLLKKELKDSNSEIKRVFENILKQEQIKKDYQKLSKELPSSEPTKIKNKI